MCGAYTVASSKWIFLHFYSQSCLFPGFPCPTAPQGLVPAGLRWDQCSLQHLPHSPVLRSGLFPYLHQLIFDPANTSPFQLLFAACAGLREEHSYICTCSSARAELCPWVALSCTISVSFPGLSVWA